MSRQAGLLCLAAVLALGANVAAGSGVVRADSAVRVSSEGPELIMFQGRLYQLVAAQGSADGRSGTRRLLNESHHGAKAEEEEECEVEHMLTPEDGAHFWITLLATLTCVCGAATAAGLTLGLLSVDKLQLEILCSPEAVDWQDPSQWGVIEPEEAREMAEQQRFARRIYPIICPHAPGNEESCWSGEPHHLLMVTLLLMNALANEALPIFLDKLMPSPIVAVLVSVCVVLVIGEIIPTALFTGEHQLRLAAALAPVVYTCKFVFALVAWPISWILDRILGSEPLTRFSKAELKTLIQIHSEDSVRQSMRHGSSESSTSEADLCQLNHALVQDEVVMVKGVLELRDQRTIDHMTPISAVKMIEYEAIFDEQTMANVVAYGHSRLPVYQGHKSNIKGVLLVKRLIAMNPADSRPVSTLENVWKPPLFVSTTLNLQALLNLFQQTKLHIALVCQNDQLCKTYYQQGTEIPQDYVLGIITMEDVLEYLIQEEINDEGDHPDSVKIKLAEAFTLQRRLPALRRLVTQERNLRKVEKQAVVLARAKGFGDSSPGSTPGSTVRSRADTTGSAADASQQASREAEDNPLLSDEPGAVTLQMH